MCNVTADVMAKLEQTVRQFLAEGRMFTGYDVTIATRNREKIQLRHDGAARGACNDMQFLTDAVEFGFDNPSNGQTVEWGKTQRPMPNNQWAFVWHPLSIDPAGYQPITNPLQPVPASAAPATAATNPITDVVSDSGGLNADGTFSPDYRGRLMVGAKFIRGIGLNAGDVVNVISDENKKTVQLSSDSNVPQSGNGISVSTLMVSDSFRVYLYNAPLRLANITAQQYKIEQKDDKTVEISA